MVRQADYVYGVVPERGEYGFESQPARRCSRRLTSFSPDDEAVAVGKNNACGSQTRVVKLTGEMFAPSQRFEIHWYMPFAREASSREGS